MKASGGCENLKTLAVGKWQIQPRSRCFKWGNAGWAKNLKEGAAFGFREAGGARRRLVFGQL